MLAGGNYLHLPERIKHELTSHSLEFNISTAVSMCLVHSIFIPLGAREKVEITSRAIGPETPKLKVRQVNQIGFSNISLPPTSVPSFSQIGWPQLLAPVLNKWLSTKQSGNKKCHSTETSLIHTTDTILNAIDEKKTTAMVLLDMSKAFDSISHKILLYKLQDLGASTSAIDWFSSYLSNRTQVLINTKISDPLPLTSEVPQGSILGPILFGIYVNDLPSIPRNCLTECYVDDT